MISAISFGWFANFGKTLTLFNGGPNRFILTNGKHPFPIYLETGIFDQMKNAPGIRFELFAIKVLHSRTNRFFFLREKYSFSSMLCRREVNL